MGFQDSLPLGANYKLITVAFKILGFRSDEFKSEMLHKGSEGEVQFGPCEAIDVQVRSSLVVYVKNEDLLHPSAHPRPL